VFNSEWMVDAVPLPKGTAGLVCRPPVIAADYRTKPGDHVTLVNINKDKGAHILAAVAEALPDVKFLGVLGGHGVQVPEVMPGNVEVVPTTPKMKTKVYARTRVLLMPSVYESWGRVGVEAMASGIPVLAHPTPGLRESLGDAGVFLDRDDHEAWAAEVERLVSDDDAWSAVSKRAKARSAELTAQAKKDLAGWVEAVEDLAGAAGRGRS
jgi:glycosyltransferase involved in cell wall biosynthesis